MANIQIQNKIEEILDKVAVALLTSDYYGDTLQVKQNQKTIRDGIIALNKTANEPLVVYQKDIKGNPLDLLANSLEGGDESTTTLENIAQNILNLDFTISIGAETGTIQLNTFTGDAPDGLYSEGLIITNLLQGTNADTGEVNPINLGQFIGFSNEAENIDVNQANEFLNTNIFELLGDQTTRQQRIDEFFTEFENLTQPPPVFTDEDGDGLLDFANSYDSENNITDDNPFDETKSIVRLTEDEGENNVNQSLENLRNRLNIYLRDVDDTSESAVDQRPDYINKSSGYLKFRNLNQGIIIRNTDSEFVEGLNPETQDYLSNGFTITMWVRFLDKKSEGTLFNFGNPTRETDPFGFKLDTLVADDKRYLRLLVYDGNGVEGANPYSDVGHWYDSHVGTADNPKVLAELATLDGLDLIDITQYLEVPMDFTEWFFICATYNPSINEEIAFTEGYEPIITNTGYWLNHFLYDPAEAETNDYVQYASGIIENGNQIRTLSTSIANASRFNNLSNGSDLIIYATEGEGESVLFESVISDINFEAGGPTGPPAYLITLNNTENQDGQQLSNGDSVEYGQIVNFPPEEASSSIVSNSGLGARCKVEIISKSDLLRARGFKVNGD